VGQWSTLDIPKIYLLFASELIGVECITCVVIRNAMNCVTRTHTESKRIGRVPAVGKRARSRQNENAGDLVVGAAVIRWAVFVALPLAGLTFML
jgi:hypothetical protein